MSILADLTTPFLILLFYLGVVIFLIYFIIPNKLSNKTNMDEIISRIMAITIPEAGSRLHQFTRTSIFKPNSSTRLHESNEQQIIDDLRL